MKASPAKLAILAAIMAAVIAGAVLFKLHPDATPTSASSDRPDAARAMTFTSSDSESDKTR